MKVGYVSTNYSIGCDADKTLRLSSLLPDKVLKVSLSNLECLRKILAWNLEHGITFFRISSNTVPFASHPKLNLDWRRELQHVLGEIGDFVREHSMRISMHPGQFVVINSHRDDVVRSSLEELMYHADLLDLMGLRDAHVQIHVGSSKGGKAQSLDRFIHTYQQLPENVKSKLVIENDDRIFNVKDCLELSSRIKIPVVLDNLHHSLNNSGESFIEAFEKVRLTWTERPMLDYSEQERGAKPGVHASTLSEDNFAKFAEGLDGVDVMLEVKDKEKSALKAVRILREMGKLE
ncbi:UV DNA damage repair endonuclease UvsE [Metallosphaera tengchongensis]|uniref:UV DNA damage repair endonuclease UvsE n=1 Tax=Metallosphaera tengchongensis TaxID=1532350 RepID=A0A6N0NVC3_9CREN|nr:UV DNA damage repair endonuclease UvsE [Metallosphaera tengchongensis]QKR00682.1 UV DNA damage repair endonuclease UvsE [Metallosphaera tengchongensis]